MTDKKEVYTVKQAVCDVLREMPTGKKYLGYQLHNKIIGQLIAHNSPKRPLDSTTLRTVRLVGDLYGVKAVSHSVSQYIKA